MTSIIERKPALRVFQAFEYQLRMLIWIACAMFGTDTSVIAGELKLYWSTQEDTVIRRANLDGTQTEQVIRTPGGVIPDIAFDPIARKMYWPSPVVGGIQRANYDGSNVQNIIDGIERPWRIAIDTVNRKAYWIDWADGNNSISRSNLDGTSRELLASNLPTPTAVEVDPQNGYYLWADSLNGRIHRTSITDNSQTAVIFDEREFGHPASIEGLAIDPINGYVYATDFAFHSIIRMRLDGSNAERWLTDGVHYPRAIVLDMTNERVIWSNEELPGGLSVSSSISSVNFLGLDRRVEFVPRWNPYIAGKVRHLAIVDVSVPEPSSSSLMVAIILFTIIGTFAVRRR
jgi:DNA-binding beta-propeller fold protein YncE